MRQIARALLGAVLWFGSCGAAVAAGAAAFDELVRQLEHGEQVFYDAKAATVFLKQLKQQLPPNDEPRLRRYQREACFLEFSEDPRAGIVYAERFISDPAYSADHLTLSYFYLCRAAFLAVSNDTARQEADLSQALALANSSEDALAQANVLSAQADLHSTRGEHAEALIRLFKAYELFQKTGNRQGVGLSLENIASAFRRMAEYDKALEYLETSEREYLAPNDSYRQAFVLLQKAFIFAEMGKTPQARAVLQQVQKIYQDIDDQRYAVAVAIELLWISNLEQKFTQSLELIAAIEQQIRHIQRKDPTFLPYNNTLYQLYQAEALAETGQPALAAVKFAAADSLLAQENNPRYMLMLRQAWSRAEAKAGRFERAYQLLTEAVALQEQLNSQAKQQREALLRFQFDSELQSQKNSQLQAENRLTGQQVAVLEAAQRWQYIAIGLFVVLALVALFYAISQIQRNRRLHKLAMTDELTQVGNRRAILAQCHRVMQQASHSQQVWSLLIVDIDHFKQCNDVYGHDAGDEVLRSVAQAMQAVLRGQDRIGRSGGEEFLVVLPDTTELQATALAEQLRQAVAALRFSNYPDLHISISIGLTQAGRHEQVREVITRADSALYQAKNRGRNQVVSC
ncbi:MAG: diguanylate cyclase [Rheinheimera sp.]|nr:MAG: diguanylate cyclase [Rheinheimera sp.]